MLVEKRSVILDTDPGIDDAVAFGFLLNDDRFDVKLITTVSGNVGIENVTQNALKLLAFYNRTIPVAKGATKPLIRQSSDASAVHGENGLAGFHFTETFDHCLLKEHAVSAMYNTIKNSATPVTIVAIGPLTNVALLLQLYPDVKESIQEVIFMGGAINRGNYGVYTEFNIGFDPEAAHVVFNSGLNMTMIGLEIGDMATITQENKETIRQLNVFGQTFFNMFETYRGDWVKDDTQMYDSTAIAYLLHPELFTVKKVFADVEIDGKYTSGATICDMDGILNQRANMTVAVSIDTKQFITWFIQSIAAFKR